MKIKAITALLRLVHLIISWLSMRQEDRQWHRKQKQREKRKEKNEELQNTHDEIISDPADYFNSKYGSGGLRDNDGVSSASKTDPSSDGGREGD